MFSKKLISIVLIASLLASTAVSVSATDTQKHITATEPTTVTVSQADEITETEKATESIPLQNDAIINNFFTRFSDTAQLTKEKDTKTESNKAISPDVEIKSIVSSVKSIVMENGTEHKLTITTDPIEISADAVQWQSTNSNVAEVDKEGNITAKGVGNCTIKASAVNTSDVYGYCTVTVTQKVEDFTFDNIPKNISSNETVTVSTTVTPAYASNKSLRWTSSDKNIVSVSQKGTLTATGKGKCTITAKTIDGSNITKSFEVTSNGTTVTPVEQKKITALSLETIRKIVGNGTVFPLEVSVTPADATEKSLNYTSTNTNVAVVDQNGIVPAVGNGTFVIYVSTKDGSNFRKGCVVSVVAKATSVQFTNKSVVCYENETVDLKPKSVPVGSVIADVVYKSTDDTVATVNENGVITATGRGICEISCISANGLTVYDKATVFVGTPVSSIKIYGDDTVIKGESTTWVARTLPTDADNKNVSWTSSNPNVANVTSNGTVYGITTGVTTIVCTALDGSGVVTTKPIEVINEPTIQQKLVDIAKAQEGNGPSKYRQWFYGYEGSGIPWCAVFVSWCFRQIDGLNKYIVASDGAGSIARESVAAGLSGEWYESEFSDTTTTPQIGDVIEFVWNRQGRYYYHDIYFSDHVGIVYDVDEKYVYTVEGNAGSDSNDASTVYLRMYDRTSGAINGYYRPDYTTK